MNWLPIIEKLHYLQSNLVGKKHSVLQPFKFKSSNIIEVQKASKIIQEHLGLSGLLFTVTYAPQKFNVGGSINLNDSNEVFIEIDDKYKEDYDIVLAILAHEICHKYLHINKLQLFPEYENEILTDAATIFTGLGKLSLNGCEKTVHNSQSTISHKVGYLNRRQFAFTYRLFCEINRIPEEEMLSKLNGGAKKEIEKIVLEEGRYFDEEYFDIESAKQKLSDTLKNEIGHSQKNIAILTRDIKVIRDIIVPETLNLTKEFHKYTKKKIDDITLSVNRPAHNEAHNYIKNLLAIENLSFFESKISDKEVELRKIGKTLEKFIAYLNNNYPASFENSNDYLSEFNCPVCDHTMRFNRAGEKALGRVKCPKCEYGFIVDTGSGKTIETRRNIVDATPPETTTEKTVDPPKKTKSDKRGFWSKIKKNSGKR